MASFLHQLKVLLWKNWLSVRRQPVWSVVLIIWPVIIFFILALTRTDHLPEQKAVCYLAPRNLQSTGMVPFLLNVLCQDDYKCKNTSYVPSAYNATSTSSATGTSNATSTSSVTGTANVTNKAASRSRLKKRSVDSGGGGATFQKSSVTAGINWTAASEALNLGKVIVQDIYSGDLKGALCNSVNLILPAQTSALQSLCNTSQTLDTFIAQALLSQAGSTSSTTVLLELLNISTQLKTVQSKTALWNFLLALPEWIKDPQRMINAGEYVLYLPQDVPYLQTCMKFILSFASQVRNVSSTSNLTGILQTLSDQSSNSELQSCISLFQVASCDSGQCSHDPGTSFDTVYWLVTTLSNETSRNACEFNGLNITCNGSVNWDLFLQASLALLKEVSIDPPAGLIRIVQRTWTLLKQNTVDQKILQKLEQEITSTYPSDLQLQVVLKQLVHLLLNTTDILITESSKDTFYTTLWTLLDQINSLVPPESLSLQSLNTTYTIRNLTQSIVNDIQYLINLSDLLSSSNVSSKTLVDLQVLLNSTINSKIAPFNDSMILLKILFISNQPAFKELQASLQTLLSLNPTTANITSTLTHAFNLFIELMSASSLTNSSLAADLYLKQILIFLNTDRTLQNNLAFLNSFFDSNQPFFFQSDAFSNNATAILSFFTPSHLQAISSNPNNVPLEFLKLISSVIPNKEQDLFQKVENVFMSLFDMVSTCQMELSNCTGYIFMFQQQLKNALEFITALNTGNTQQRIDGSTTLGFSAPSDVEKAVLNKMFLMIACSQALDNSSCNTAQDIYKNTLGELSSILNMTLENGPNLLATLPLIEQLKQNIDSVLQAFGSVNLTQLTSQLVNITRLSNCYMNTLVSPLQCTMELTASLGDLLQMLPFPQPTGDIILAVSSIAQTWLGEMNGASDTFNQLSYLYNMSNVAFHNLPTLQEMHTNLIAIVDSLEELRVTVNLSSVATGKLLGELLETLKAAKINYTLPSTLLSQTNQELEDVRSQLQTVQWYILYVKNLTEAFQTTSNIDPFVTMAQFIIGNVLSSVKSNPSLIPIADEVQNVFNLLEKSDIIPALQSLLNDTMQGEDQSIYTFIKHTVSIIKLIIQQEFVNWTHGNLIFNDISNSDATFVLQLLQKYDGKTLANLSSVLSLTERVLLTMETLVNDLHPETGFSYNLQIIYNISQQVMHILYNAEDAGSMNTTVLYDIYNVFLGSWNGNILTEFPLLKNKLMELLHLSIQCLSETITPTLEQNCSSTDIIQMVQQILNDLGCQISLALPMTDANMTLSSILEYAINTTWQANISECAIESATKEDLACLVKNLEATVQLISRTNLLIGQNTTWVPEVDGALAIITDKFSAHNITCMEIDRQIGYIIFQMFESQSTDLQSLISLLTNQTLSTQDLLQYSQYLAQMSNIVKLYVSTQEDNPLNDTLLNSLNNIMLQLFEIAQMSTKTNKSLITSEMLGAVSNLLTQFSSVEESSEMLNLLNILNRVMNLTSASLRLNSSMPHSSLANIFDGNCSMIAAKLIEQISAQLNITSPESCENSLLNLLALYHSRMNLSFDDTFYSNISSWTCSLILRNNSGFDWLEELKAITSMMFTSEAGTKVDNIMKIIASLAQSANFSGVDIIDHFVTPIIEILNEKEPPMNQVIYQTLHESVNSLQSILKEALSSGNSSPIATMEKITLTAIGAVNSILKNLNITGSEEILLVTSEIFQIYFNMRNNTVPMDSLAQKILASILTVLQNSGFENDVIQTLESQILNLSSEKQTMLQNLLEIIMSAINDTTSDSATQAPSYKNNLIFNIIENIVQHINITKLSQSIGANKDITEMIVSLLSDILSQNWTIDSLGTPFPPNGSNEDLTALESLLSSWISENIGHNGLYFNYSTSLMKIFGLLFTQAEKDQVMKLLQLFLDSSNGTVNAPFLLGTLENLYDLLHLNNRNSGNVLELYIKQLFYFISGSQINQSLSELSILLNTTRKLSLLQTSDLSNSTLELLPFFDPSSLYNITNDNSKLVSVLLNLLSKNIPHEEQQKFINITDAIVLLLELVDNCTTDWESCLGRTSAISSFEMLVKEAFNTFASMENGSHYLEISNETVLEFENLTQLQTSLINNIFTVLWIAHNVSGDFTNVYQEVLSACHLILNISRDLNTEISQSDLEMLKNYTQTISVIQQVISTSNITEALLQIINIHTASQCTNQTLLCTLNLTSHLLGFLQSLQLPNPAMKQIVAASSLVEFWIGEINTTADVYQQMVSLYTLTEAALQNEPALRTILMTLTDLWQAIENIKVDNTSFSTVEDIILACLKLLEPENQLTIYNHTIAISNTQVEDVKAQIQIIQWFIMYITNQIENNTTSGDINALYRLVQLSLTDMMPSLQDWFIALVQSHNMTESLAMASFSSHEVDTLFQLLQQLLAANETMSGEINQLQNWFINLPTILNEVDGLNTSEFTTILTLVNSIMNGNLSIANIDELLNIVQTAMAAKNITVGPEVIQIYDFFLSILNQTHSMGNVNLTQVLKQIVDSSLTLDCNGVFKILTAIYKMVQNADPSSPLSDDTLLSNITMDICGLLQWNNSQNDWISMLQSSRGILLYIEPLVPDSMRKYFTAAEYLLGVGAELVTQPALTQNNIVTIMNIAPVINELFNNVSSTTDWMDDQIFQKLIYFLVDIAWSSSSPKEVLLLKVQNFIVVMIQDIQNVLKVQHGSPGTVWLSFALDVVESFINKTQNTSSEDRFLVEVWDSLKDNGLENMIISAVGQLVSNNGSDSSENFNTLQRLIQFVFNLTDLIITETSLSSSYGGNYTTINILELALSDLLQILLPQNTNTTTALEDDLQVVLNVTSLLSHIEMLINSLSAMKIPGDISNDPTILLNIVSAINQSAVISEISNFIQMFSGPANTQYGELVMDALQMLQDLIQINKSINIQDLSAIISKYLPIYLEMDNETQSSVISILTLWRQLYNLTDTLSSDVSNTIIELLPSIQSHILINESTDVGNLTSWLVTLISGYIPATERDRFEGAANASLLLFDNIQSCSVRPETCTELTAGVQNFVLYVTQLESAMQNGTLDNSSLPQFGPYDQSQITVINEIFLVLSYAMGQPYNSSTNQTGVYEEVLTLTNWLLNTTMDSNVNVTVPPSLQDLVAVLTSANITHFLLQIENLVSTSNCSNQAGIDSSLCQLDVMYHLTQLLQILPLGQATHDTLSVVSSLAGQWLSQIDGNISAYQQLTDLYNATALVLQYQPMLQAINTSLVNIVHILQNMGALPGVNLSDSGIALNLLSEILQKAESESLMFNISTATHYDISGLLQAIHLQLDIVNWLMLQSENQTGIVANSPGTYTMQTLTQWLLNNYQQINLIIKGIESAVTSFNPSSPDTTVDALKTVVGDLLTIFLPQTGDAHLEETLQTVLNITRILLEVSGQNTISQLEMVVKNFSALSLSDISKDPTLVFHLLSAINQTGLPSEMANFIQVFIGPASTQYGKLVMDALQMFQDLVQMNKTINIQELSAIISKYLPIYLEMDNETQSSVNSILTLWRQLYNLTNTLSSDVSNTIIELLPSIQSHILINESTDVGNLTSWLITLISGYIPAAERDRFEGAANASLLLIDAIQSCSVRPKTCTELTAGVQNFVLYVTQLESAMQNGTWNNSSLPQFGPYDQSQITVINEIFLVLSDAMEQPYNSSTNQTGVYEEVLTLTNWLLNTTMEGNVNVTIPPSLQDLVAVLTSANITHFLLQIENLVSTSNCSNQAGTDSSLCQLDVMYHLTQLLQILPLGQATHDTLSVVSSLAGQWLSQIDGNISAYQQLTKLYNVTALAIQYQPMLQAINTSLVNIVHILQNMGALPGVNLSDSDIALNLLSEILQKAQSESLMFNVSTASQYDISGLLQAIHLQLDIVNWLMLQAENQTGIVANSPGTYTMQTLTQWLLNNYQQINLIIKDVESVVMSFNLSSPDTTVDALKTVVGDLLTMFLPQTGDAHLEETLQTVLNVTRILLEVSGQNTINQLEMLVKNFSALTLSDISKDPTVVFHILSAINQIGLPSEIANFIQVFTGPASTQYGKLVMDVLQMFQDFANLTDLLHMFSDTIQNPQVQGLLYQIASEAFTKVPFIENLLINVNTSKDVETAALLLQEMNNINTSLILTTIDQVSQTILGIQGLASDQLFHNNITAAKVFQIVQGGMEILYNIQAKGTIGKELIYQIYNFTYLLVQDEWSWVPFQNISAMETELLDVFYLAMTPFLGGNESQAYTGNCSAQDVLQILIQTIFRNGTVSESLGQTTCNWQFSNNGSESGPGSNYTLQDMIYLALQSSPIFHSVCSKDNLHPLAEEITCLVQIMAISMGVLADLNTISGLQIPLIQSLNNSLTFTCSNMPSHNFTIRPETQLVQIVDDMVFNQSNPIYVFIQFLMKHHNSTVQISDLPQLWPEISNIIKSLPPLNGSFDNHIYELIEAAGNLTFQPSWVDSWQALNSVLSMNWTLVNSNASLSALETIRRAVALINSGMDAKTIQIYQTIVSIFKDPSLSAFLNATNTNTTVPSVVECTAALNALARFSDSIWVAFDPTHLNLNDELLSNLSSLACEVWYFKPVNYTWISNLEIIMPYVEYYIPAEITQYFTALQKVISFWSDIRRSPNVSQENIIVGVYELFIQELRIFSNTTIIADWMEIIPVSNFTSILLDLRNNATAEQVLILEKDSLYLLSRIFNATSYVEGFSMLQDLITYLPDNISSLTTATDIKQQYMNLVTKLTVTVQIPSLTGPYGTVMNCLKNVTEDVSKNLTGHLEVAIQLAQDLFTQSNKSTNASMIPDLLKQKIYQLQSLTTTVCGLVSANDSLSNCYLSCQYLTLLQDAADIVTMAITIAQSATSINSPQILTSFLSSVWQSIEAALSTKLNSIIPINEFSNLTALLNVSNINVTNGSFKSILGSIFNNVTFVEVQLQQVMNLSQTSITALMNVPFPSDITQIGGWFITLNQCRTNLSLVDEPLQVFCNLPPDRGYQMAVIFLQNVDIIKLAYRLLMPASLQTNLDMILSVLQQLIDYLDYIAAFINENSNQNNLINNLLNLMSTSSSSSSRAKRSIDLSEVTGSSRANTISANTILKLICSGNYEAAILYLYGAIKTADVSRSSSTARNLSQIYDIPTDNAFCLNLFTGLVSTTSGASFWLLLKPLVYGQILYTPNTNVTQKIMEKTKNNLLQIEDYKNSINGSANNFQKVLGILNLVQAILPGLLKNPIISGILTDFLHINITDLNHKLALVQSNAYLLSEIIQISNLLVDFLSCVVIDRMHPMDNVADMTAAAMQLQTNNELFAAVAFNLSTGTSRQSGASGLPKQVSYSISMRSLLSADTSVLRDYTWIPGPNAKPNAYSRGFVYLQENIERAIIEMQTNKVLDNIAVQYQPMPYPCYKEDGFLYSMAYSLPIALMITWVLFIAAFVKKLVHEKELRLHEYMKMMGVNSSSHFFAWLIESASFLVISSAILVIILKFGKILTLSNGFILFLFMLDYSLTVIAMSYLISVFFHNTNVAALSGSLIYIITFFPFIAVVSKQTTLSFAGKTLLSLFSPTALSYATQYIVSYEEQNEGIQWYNMYSSPNIGDTFNFGWLCWMMLIDSMIYFIVGWYIRVVFPGKYGIGAVWYFPVLPSFWMECCGCQNRSSRKPSGLTISNIVAHGVPEKKGDDLYPYNEQEPNDLNIGVSLHGLTKAYQDKLAVHNLNLNFYEGHITSLLGHNGAGKTTTLSMLMGLFSATSGTIYVYGQDIRTHLYQVRKSMGVCMQYDVLFDHLTTKEHLLLYGSIKAPQLNKRELHCEVKRVLKDTGLYNHRYKPVMTLSGGMKRKLSICIALIGGSKVVILDEPTTGVDPCSRRSIWEVISKNKQDKTIILSTHHLDEAEVLSDRIAFLEQGGLRCCGTPMFLKEKFGSGYHLIITKEFSGRNEQRLCDVERVTSLIHSHIPEATLKEDVGGEVVYVLPPFRAEISNAYLSLLRDLDSNLNDLHIDCYGISDTTIEEVFLKLVDDPIEHGQGVSKRAIHIPNPEEFPSSESPSSNFYSVTERDDQPLTEIENVKGSALLFKKIGAIFIKRFHNSKRNWKGLLSQILLPVLFVIAAMGLGSLSMSSVNYPEILLSPELYGTTDQSVPFGLYNESSEDIMNAMFSYPGIDNSCLDQNAQCLPENGLGPWSGNYTEIFGTCNCSTGYEVCAAPDVAPPHRKIYSGQMMYNVTGNDMEDYLVATTLNFIQQRYGGYSFGIPVSDINTSISFPPNLTVNKVWYNKEGPHSLPAFLNSFSNFLLRNSLPSNESAQYGISVYNKPLPGVVTSSSSTLTLVNTLVALSVLVGYSITTASFATYIVKEYDNGSKRLQHIAGVSEVLYWLTNFLYDLAIYLIPVALSIAMIAAFKLPAFYNYPNLGAVSLLFILFGYATFTWMYLIAGTFKNVGMAFISYVCINLFIGINTIISSSVVYMLMQTSSGSDTTSLNNTYHVLINVFKIFPQFCFGYGLIELSQQQAIYDQLAVYGTYETINVFSMDILGYMFVAMTVQGTFCLILRLLINNGIIYSVKTFFKKTFRMYQNLIVKDPEEDEDVVAERKRVESGEGSEDLLVLKGLTKLYHQVNKKVIAVNNMSLGIPPGECFGLLGVNGAGKTTTFKMLTGDVSPSAGKIQVRNHAGNLVDILGFNTDWSSFGYCPQEDALDELMTGDEHLYYYARIHGIPEKNIRSVTNQLLQKLELVQYKDKITANYSCGTRRKLSTALALIGRPSILLLDEPSSGMDPKTKRHLWKIIAEEIQNKCSVVLTSHSMEECEALCTRLAIMVRGKFQCIGSLQHIKNRFGSGFTVKMHLKDSSVNVQAITSFMHLNFPNTYLKEQHFTMVEYHVPVSTGGVAAIFELVEANKPALNIIHFSVRQTTLDEVFINFAQAQASPENSNASSQEFQQVVVA